MSRILAKKTHSEEWWQTKAPVTVIRCSANYVTTGERCRSEAATGTTVCDKHGARLPAVQAAAARRIGMSAEDMVKALIEWANDPNVDMRERVKIAQDMLDRAGHGAISKHLVGVSQADPVERLFMDLLASPDGFADRVPLPPPEIDPRFAEYNRAALEDDDEIVEAELVEEPALHTIDVGQAPKTPAHIREALERLL